MAKQAVQPSITFVNPNTPKDFERQLRKILTGKLLAQRTRRLRTSRQEDRK